MAIGMEWDGMGRNRDTDGMGIQTGCMGEGMHVGLGCEPGGAPGTRPRAVSDPSPAQLPFTVL